MLNWGSALLIEGVVADRQGFEPWRRSPAYTLSRRAPSTTRPPVHQRGLARPLGDLQEACATIKKRQNPSLQNLTRCLKEKKLLRIALGL